ncbi:MAG: methyltransferase domain-containing protein, partial [Candidatus Methanomethylophilus sp.]|nr:methyltransferase domain-containing protein [Methanomethylophilus sp.]
MDTDTLEFYETNAEAYAAESLTHDVLDIRGRFIARLPKGARILDLGCGSGRDSFAFSRLGFETVPVDGSENMCREAERYTGLPVRHVRFSELDYQEEFDGVWACASLLHVPSAELPHVLNMVRQALRIGGIFF